MDNTNILPAESPKKINKGLVFLFSGVVVITICLVSYYLYIQYGVEHRVSNPSTQSQNNDAISYKSTPFVYTRSLNPAKIREPYTAVVEAGVYYLNTQIENNAVTGLPPGLKLTECSTEYNSAVLPKDLTNINSLIKCTIEGTPQKSGNFTVRVYFSVPGETGTVFKDLQLVVNP